MKPNKPWAPFLFAAPALVIFSFAVAVPLLATVGFSFVEWSGYGPWVFVGIDNYKELLTDALFAKSFLNVSFYIAVTLVLEVLVGLCLAGLISARRGILMVPGRLICTRHVAHGCCCCALVFCLQP